MEVGGFTERKNNQLIYGKNNGDKQQHKIMDGINQARIDLSYSSQRLIR